MTNNRIRWQKATDIGRRQTNEDVVRVRHGVTDDPGGDHPFVVLCEGIGGHEHGEVAAATAAQAFEEQYLQEGMNSWWVPIAARLERALQAANRAIGTAIARDRTLLGMGTSLTAAAVTRTGIEWISVGHSPLYVATASGRVRALNTRHNAIGNPHELTASVVGGPTPEVSRSSKVRRLRNGTIVIAATKALDTLSATAIGRLAADREQVAAALVGETMKAGKPRQENVTVATLRESDMPRESKPLAVGIRDGNEVEVSVGGRPLDWRASLKVAAHSPTGPEWGYRGSGPAQLALALLMDMTDDATARRHYQQFNDEMIATLPKAGWTIPCNEITEWVAQHDRRRSRRRSKST